MSQNLLINPTTKDYVIDDNGKPIPTDSVEMATYFALTIPQGQWLYGTPNQGSKLFELNQSKRTSSIEQQLQSSVSDAIERQLLPTGQVVNFRTLNLDATRTSTLNRIEVIPAEIQASGQLNFVSV